MARFNEILSGRYNRALTKLFSMKGTSPAPQLASEITPAIQMFHGRENRHLEGWRTFGARTDQGAVAAQDTVIRFINPLGSGVIAVLESLLVHTSVADILFIEQATTPSAVVNLAAPTTACGFDPRFEPSGTGTGGAACQVSSANNVGQGARVIWGEVATQANVQLQDLIVYDDQQITILPGIDFQIRDSVLNTVMRACFRWRERVLESSELGL